MNGVKLTDRGILAALAVAILAVWVLVAGATVARCAAFWYGIEL